MPARAFCAGFSPPPNRPEPEPVTVGVSVGVSAGVCALMPGPPSGNRPPGAAAGAGGMPHASPADVPSDVDVFVLRAGAARYERMSNTSGSSLETGAKAAATFSAIVT